MRQHEFIGFFGPVSTDVGHGEPLGGTIFFPSVVEALATIGVEEIEESRRLVGHVEIVALRINDRVAASDERIEIRRRIRQLGRIGARLEEIADHVGLKEFSRTLLISIVRGPYHCEVRVVDHVVSVVHGFHFGERGALGMMGEKIVVCRLMSLPP